VSDDRTTRAEIHEILGTLVYFLLTAVIFLEQRRKAACHFIKEKMYRKGRGQKKPLTTTPHTHETTKRRAKLRDINTTTTTTSPPPTSRVGA